jgi:1,2-diacylglycerol-3-alpha-glucose alpha-1,2-galactosyltransferase
MRINFVVEDLLVLKYIGCATVAKSLYRQLLATGQADMYWKSYWNRADVCHYHTFGPGASTHRRMTRGIKVLTAHSTPRINAGNIKCARAINKFYPRIYRKFDHIIAISQPCYDEVKAMVPEMPMTLIPNGIKRDFFKPDKEKRAIFREQFNIPDDARVAVTVAQQTPRKGLYDFLALSRKCPEITWVWVGGLPYGSLSKDYRRIKAARRRCGENVIFTGYIDEIVKAYNGADVFFMPSYAETFGLVILEALACGIPVIARDIPEFRDIFADNILYFSTREESIPILSDEDLLKRAATAARTFTEDFDITDIAQKHLALYRSLMES